MASAPIRQPRGPPSSAGVYAPTPGAPSATASSQPASQSTASGVGGHASPGPPMPDAESLLRRNKTVATAARASQAAPAASGPSTSSTAGFNASSGDAAAYRRSLGATTVEAYARQLRSGSFSGLGPGAGFSVVSGQSTLGSVDGGLVRRTSGRSDFASRGGQTTEETLIEAAEGAEEPSATEPGNWYKGLARQSSLPSRRRE